MSIPSQKVGPTTPPPPPPPPPRPQLIILACLAAVCALWASPTRVAASGSALDIPPPLFFATQPKVRGQPAVWQTLRVGALRPQVRAYRASRWRWRRAASAQPLPQDVETVATPETAPWEYALRTRDAGYFLSACIQLAVTRDVAPWYCTPFVGPVLYNDAPPCTGRELSLPDAVREYCLLSRYPYSPNCKFDGELSLPDAVREANADPPPRGGGRPVSPRRASWAYWVKPLHATPPRGRWRLRPALDGRGWHEPVDLLPWPAGGWAVAERAGRILRHRPGQTPCLLLDLTAEIGPLGTENGLLSLALDPQFPAAPFLYVYYTRGTHDARALQSRLARFPVADGRLRREAELVLLETAPRPHRWHFGGALGFGPDGLLYLGLGDRQDPAQAPQLDSLLGKILRLDVRQATRARPYRIPAANPWRGQAGARPEAYARGFRNPWRLAFDPRDGALWVADVGQDHREEVNRVQAGADYGWPLWEGDLCHGEPAACAVAPHAAPVAAYDHAQGNCAVIGGVVYRGAALPGLDGAYLFGDHCSGRVWTLTPRAGGGWRMRQLLQLPSGLRLLAFAAAGEAVYLLVADGADGTVLQLAPA